MKKTYAFIILFASYASLLFAQTPWLQHIEEIKSKASSGDPDAQGILSVYIQSRSVGGTDGEAFSLAEKSANSSSGFGYYALGRCYEIAVGTTKDEAKAKNSYSKALPYIREKAVDQGNAVAQAILGACYSTGRGLPKDETEAVNWYRKAAEQGDALAQANLGNCHENGSGVPKDETEAVNWYQKAAEQGNAFAQIKLGLCYAQGIGVSQDLSESLKGGLKNIEF